MKVSILVPVYNVEKYIHRCINSILAQTFTNIECIIVDDCSPDNCPKICDEYSMKRKMQE
jgi:glycosyltransferase involved in cell wall biosynthesis